MRRFYLFALITLFTLHGATQAAEKSSYVSATFQDILSRVVERDKTSGAILRVRTKDDSAIHAASLNFSIKQDRTGDVVVVLYLNNMINDGIYEKYRLKMDNAMQEELGNQGRYQEVLKERAKKELERRAKEIAQLTGGKLKYGMSPAEVEAVKGKPSKTERPIEQALFSDAITWIYPDMKLFFRGSILQNVEVLK
jgi:hypothetical protein